MLCNAGQQIAQSAASDGAAASAAVNEEEVRGPHASLAVRLQVMLLASKHPLHVMQTHLTPVHHRCDYGR